MSILDFVDPPVKHDTPSSSSPLSNDLNYASIMEDVVPECAPATLIEWAVLILNTPNPLLKVGQYSPSNNEDF
jgi:hypothetical protein